MKKARKMISRVWRTVKREEMQILPGHLAFFMVMAIFAIFPLLGLIGSSFISNELITSIEKTLPTAVYTILESLMDIESKSGIIILVLFAVYFASDGCNAMIIASNVVYKIKNHNFLKQRIKSLIMTIILIFLILFIVIVPAFGGIIISAISKSFPSEAMNTVGVIYDYLKIPLSFILIFMCVKILYTIAPDARIPSRFTNYGTLFTTILWVVITRIYAIYLNNFNTYNLFYGSFANVVILLFWMYLLAYVFTMGMALNSDRYFESKKVSSDNDIKE